MLNNKRQVMIQELRHQLYYLNSGLERDAVRRQLEYWIYYSRNA